MPCTWYIPAIDLHVFRMGPTHMHRAHIICLTSKLMFSSRLLTLCVVLPQRNVSMFPPAVSLVSFANCGAHASQPAHKGNYILHFGFCVLRQNDVQTNAMAVGANSNNKLNNWNRKSVWCVRVWVRAVLCCGFDCCVCGELGMCECRNVWGQR